MQPVSFAFLPSLPLNADHIQILHTLVHSVLPDIQTLMQAEAVRRGFMTSLWAGNPVAEHMTGNAGQHQWLHHLICEVVKGTDS